MLEMALVWSRLADMPPGQPLARSALSRPARPQLTASELSTLDEGKNPNPPAVKREAEEDWGPLKCDAACE